MAKFVTMTIYLTLFALLILMFEIALIFKHPKYSVSLPTVGRATARVYSTLEPLLTNQIKAVPGRLSQIIKSAQILKFGNLDLFNDRWLKTNNRLIKEIKIDFFKYKDLVIVWKSKTALGLNRLRQALLSSIIGYFPHSLGNLLKGMVFGGGSGLPPELKHSFEVTGMLHVLSASGYNVGLVVSVGQGLIRRFCSRKIALIFTLGLVCIYLYLAEMTPSVIRAGFMCIFQLLAQQWLFRSYQGFWLLILTVITMLLIDRAYLTSLSFQLSVTACLGILIWGWVLENQSLYDFSTGQGLFLNRERTVQSLWNSLLHFGKESLVMTVAAQSLSWPLQIIHFQDLSLVSLVANPAALWLTPSITIFSLFFMMVSTALGFSKVVSAFVLPLLAWPLTVLAYLFVGLVTFFGQWERGVLHFSPSLPQWFLPAWWLGVFALALIWKKWRNRYSKRLYVC